MMEQRQLEPTLRGLERQDLLILNGLGYVPFSKADAELLFEVASRVYERLSLTWARDIKGFAIPIISRIPDHGTLQF